MLGHLSIQLAITAIPADWRQSVSWGDILSFRFPVEDSEEPPKRRPCLVLNITKRGDRRYALIAYGTSADTRANRGYEIRLSGAEARAAGLHRPTRFVGARRLLVALDHPGFVIREANGAPVIGRLSGDAFERMNAVRARIQAEADIAADRRSERSARPSRHRRTEPRPARIKHSHLRRRKLAKRA